MNIYQKRVLDIHPTAELHTVPLYGKILKRGYHVVYKGKRQATDGRHYPETLPFSDKTTSTMDLAWFVAWKEIERQFLKKMES